MVAGVLKNSSSSSDKQGIMLTDFDVMNLRQKKIQNWINWKEIWALKYGNGALAISNVLTNFSINQFYRRQFNLHKVGSSMGIISSLLTSTILPSAAAGAAVTLYFSMNLLKVSQDECLMCREIRTIMLHMGIGTILPTIVSWHGNFLQAEAYKTYRVPNAQNFFKNETRNAYLKQTREIWSKTNKEALRPIGTNWGIQLVLVSFLLWQQQKEFYEKVEPIQFLESEIKQVVATKTKNF